MGIKIITLGSLSVVYFPPTSAAPDSGAPCLVVIPSLLNGTGLFFLDPGALAEGLSAFAPCYVICWNDPVSNEYAFDFNDFLSRRLLVALELIYQRQRTPLILLGHCLGGLMCLAASVFYPSFIRALVLLATPWDFHVSPYVQAAKHDQFTTLVQQHLSCTSAIEDNPLVPYSMLRQLFHVLNPKTFIKALTTSPKKMNHQILNWLSNGHATTQANLLFLIQRFMLENIAYCGHWRVSNILIDLQALSAPIIHLIGTKDTLVSEASSKPLLECSQTIARYCYETGHTGLFLSESITQKVIHLLIHHFQPDGSFKRESDD